MIPSPLGVSGFGGKLMLRGDLLVETSFGTLSVHSYSFDVSTQTWIPAGWEIASVPPAIEFSAATDGERIVFCLTRCTSYIRDGAGVWGVEAETTELNPDVPDVQISGEWMVGGGHIYNRVASDWLPTQAIPEVLRFVLHHDALLAYTQGGSISIWHRDGMDWAPFAALGTFNGPRAFSGERAIAGIQSFADTAGTGWQPAGSIAGIENPDTYLFGAALAIDDGKLRVGIPGSSRIDFLAGEVAIYALGGPSSAPLRASLVPTGHVPWRGFGKNLFAGENLLAVSSNEGKDGPGKVYLFNRSSQVLVQEIPLPASDPLPGALSLQDGTLIVAVGQSAGYPQPADGLLVYRHDENGNFVLAQTLVEQRGEAEAGFGLKVVLRGDWLVSGDTVLHRSGPDADFVRAGTLDRPSGVELDGRTLAADGDTLIVAPASTTGPSLAFVLGFDDSDGWVLQCVVPRAPPFDTGSSRCAALTISGDRGGCLLQNHDGSDALQLLVIRPDAGVPDWEVTDAATVAVPSTQPPYALVSSGPYIAVGLPASPVGGPDDDSHILGGRVLVYLMDDVIFAADFD